MGRFRKLTEKHQGNHTKAFHEYFQEVFRDKRVTGHTNKGPIEAVFTGGSWNEIKKGMHNDPLKASLVPHIPDIIATGEYVPESPAHAHPDVKQFHTYRKTVRTIAGPKEAIVDVAEWENPELSQPRHQVYSLTREGTKNYEKRHKESSASESGRNPMPAEDSLNEDIISPQFEVVNLRVEDMPSGPFSGPFAGLNAISLPDQGPDMRRKMSRGR